MAPRAIAQQDAQPSVSAPVVLILDASGSMVRDSGSGRTRMDDAREAVTASLSALPTSAQVGILVFGTQTGNADSDRAVGCTDVRVLAEIGSPNRPEVVREVEAIQASGFTPISHALRQAAEMVGNQKGRIVLVSDGVETCSPPPACSVASDLRAANPGLTIDVVGFAVDDDEEAQQQLTCISGAAGGQYISAADAVQLAGRLSASADTRRARSSLSAFGARNVGLGMSLNEVLTVVGGGAKVDERTVAGVKVIYVECSWATIELRNGAVVSITPSIDLGTAEGVRVGSELVEVEAIYGQPVTTGSDDLGDYRIHAVGRGETGYRIYADGSRVRLIVVCRCAGPSYDLTRVATWEATFEGIGPLRLGMTAEEARAAVASLSPRSGESVVWVESPAGGVVAHLNSSGRVYALTVLPLGMWDARSAGELAASGAALPHAAGQRLGAPLATVRTAYPGGTTVTVEAAGENYYVVSDRRGRGLQFHTWVDGVVAVVAYDFLNDEGGSRSALTPPWDMG